MKIGIIGLGYVGLPLAISFSEKYSVTAFDTNSEKIFELKQSYDRTNEIAKKDLKKLNRIKFTDKIINLNNSNIFIVAVPTPVDSQNEPDLSNLKKACKMVAKVMKKKSIVIDYFKIKCQLRI